MLFQEVIKPFYLNCSSLMHYTTIKLVNDLLFFFLQKWRLDRRCTGALQK